jgi:hypothetical protein
MFVEKEVSKSSYSTAWRAKQAALTNINGSYEEAYAQLRQYYVDVIQDSPDSIIALERTSEANFRRLFICYAASQLCI